MNSYECCYAGFHCKITLQDGTDEIIQQLKQDFDFYYDIKPVRQEASYHAEIVIAKEAFEGMVEGETVCIHSSHSRNKKYLLDGSMYTQEDASIYARKKVEGEDIYYYIEETYTKVKMLNQQKQVIVSGGNLYETLVYIYESLLNLYIESAGGILLHGACCKWGDKGCIISGKSGGGKTSLLFAMLEENGLFHSNDRVALFRKGDKVIAYSIPIPVNAPIKVMRKMEEWKDTKLVKQAEDDTKIRFRVSELNRLFHENMVKELEITDIINVRYNDLQPGYEMIQKNKLFDYVDLLSPYDENHPKWLPLFEYPDNKEVETRLDEIGKQTETYCVYGNDTFSALKMK